MNTTNLSGKQQKLKNAFNPTKPIRELLKTFREMEKCFDKVHLVMECLTLVKSLQGANRLEDSRLFTKKMNKLLIGNEADNCSDCSLVDNFDFSNAKVLNMMGSVCLDAKSYDDSLKYLTFADKILTKLEKDESNITACVGNCLLRAVETNQYKLHKVTLFTNKLKESAVYALKHLEVKEKLLGKDCIEIALANMDVFFAYGGGMNFREAIPFGWKALEIQIKCLGSDSEEVANMRFNLSFMYHQLGEHDKAYELEELSDKVLKVKARDSPDEMIKAGRYEEAIEVLKDKVSHDDITEEERALDILCMANAFYEMGKFPDAKKHLRTAEEILKKCPGLYNQTLVAASFVKMCVLYEKMNDTESALSLTKRVLAFPDLPQNLLLQSLSSLLTLVPESGKVREEIPDMLAVVEKLKVSFGPESREVGHVYAHLGVAYGNLGRLELALKILSDAKSILDATIGPNHINSLKTSHTLSEFYAKLGRYAGALEIEEKIVGCLKGLAPSELGFMHEVSKHLSKMKKRVAESPTSASSQSKDGGPSDFKM